jgi:hypothetical protein
MFSPPTPFTNGSTCRFSFKGGYMKRFFSILSGALFLSSTLTAWATSDRTGPPIISWQPPAFYTAASSGRTALTDLSQPLPFVPVAPCRQYSTLLTTKLVDPTPRTITLSGAPCGIPATAHAVAVNITIFNIAAGSTGVFRVDTVSPPTVAWINYPATEIQRGNAGVLSTTSSPANIVVQINQGGGTVDFVVDVFGWYGDLTTSGGFDVGNAAAGDFAVLGEETGAGGIGVWGLTSGTAGEGVFGYNGTATGFGVLGSNPLGIGVEGNSTSGLGVKGISATNNAVWAETTGAWDALFATGGRHGVYSVGRVDGVVGISTATTGITQGVLGSNTSTTAGASGVMGQDASGYNPSVGGQTIGVLGNSQTGFAVFGQSRYISVYGQLRNGTDVDLSFGLLGTTFGTAFDSTVGPWGVFAGGNFGASGSKHFVEPHPTDPKKDILYSSLEGREVGTYFRGTASIVNHEAVIVIPEDFRIVTAEEGLTVQVTPIGGYSQVYVESKDLNQIVIRGSQDVPFDYMVNGVRRAFKNFEPVQTGYVFMPQSPSDRMPLYLTEEAKARLISNGTYNPDGTVNMTTAERAGFTKIWADREAEAKAAAAKNAK